MNPSELFPRLLAGISLCLKRAAAAAAGDDQKSTVFLMVLDESMKISVMFKDDTQPLTINPIHVQYVEILEEKSGQFEIRLLYGTHFLPNELIFSGLSQSVAMEMKAEFEEVQKYVLKAPYNSALDMFLSHQFNLYSHNGNKSMCRDVFTALMKSISGHISSKDIKNYLNKSSMIEEDFRAIYRALLDLQKFQSEALTEVFNKSLSQGGDRKHGLLGFDSLKTFLVKVQQEKVDEEQQNRLSARMQAFITKSTKRTRLEHSHFSFQDFLSYMFSVENDILDPRRLEIDWSEANEPLSHYFINSSHNTFLTGHQLKCDSSAEVYAKLLHKGVRCVEIDMWDGVDGCPVVTHGNTLCSKIRLVDIVKVIADNAFASGNPFPVILSLEDHCSLAQQVKAAAIFREGFGGKLLVGKVEQEDKNELPSPAQLCGKIILKHKKLATPSATDNNGSSSSSAFTLQEKGFLVKIGENGVWKRTNVHLDRKMGSLKFTRLSTIRQEEFFVSTISDASCLEKLSKSGQCEDGAFFIRRCRHESGEFILTVCLNGEMLAFPIAETTTGNFQLFGQEFKSLAETVAYYKRNEMPIAQKCAVLGNPLSLKDFFQLQEWYLPHLSEHMTIQALGNRSEDGTFLVRRREHSPEKEDNFVLSFVISQMVYHVNVVQLSNGLLELGGVPIVLSDVSEMVDYFKTEPIYGHVRLTTGPGLWADEGTSQGLDGITGSKYLIGHDLNLKGIEDKSLTLSIGQEVAMEFMKNPDMLGNIPIVKLLMTSTGQEVFLAPNDKSEWIQLDTMLGNWVSPITNDSIIQDHKDPTLANSQLSSKKVKIAQELSDLVVYCVATPFTPLKLANLANEAEAAGCEKMSSFNESRAKTLMVESNVQKFQAHHQKCLSRIYPKATRTDSSNYNPVPFWISGAQLVALNFQTPDKELQINQGWFLRNGSCGYVLKPECLRRKGGFDPFDTALVDKSLHLSIAILSGRHLHPDIKKGADCNTFVKVEVIGCPIDCCYGVTSKICANNAFNPSWDERFNLGLIHVPSLAVLRISVYNQIKNPVPQNELLCQATLPVDYIRQGYRSVRMRNGFGEVENCLASLLVFVKIDSKKSINSRSNSSELDDMLKNFSNLQKKQRSMSRASILISEQEAEEVALCMKRTEDDLKKLMSQKTLPASSSIWSRLGSTDSQDMESSFISVGNGSESSIKRVKSDKFIAVL